MFTVAPHRCRALALAILTGSLLAATAAPASAKMVTLHDKLSGLSVRAPAGYKLSFDPHHGMYLVSNRRRYARFMFARSPFQLKATAAAVVKGLGAKVSHARQTKHLYSATVRFHHRTGTLRISSLGGNELLVALLGPVSGSGRERAIAARTARVSVADIATLSAIVNSHRGGLAVPLNVTLPTRRFTAPAVNGATATVLNRTGWQYGGTDTGYLYGGSTADRAAFELGGVIWVNYPGSPSPLAGFPTFPLVNSESALVNVMPAWKAIQLNEHIVFDTVAPVAGTAGLLGPNYDSGMYLAHFTINGVGYQGLFTIGTADYSPGLDWIMYFSYVAVSDASPGGIMPALMDTWTTWDNSAASNSRLAIALNNVLTTPPLAGGPIDPAVFQNAANDWDEYIRGPEE
jgi:hypothetical protein